MKHIATLFKIPISLIKILDKDDRKSLLFLQLALVVMGLLELGGVGVIFPFTRLILNPNTIEDFPVIIHFFSFFDIEGKREVISYLGIAASILFVLNNLFIILTVRSLTYLSQKMGHKLASRLYEKYLNQDYLFHVNNNSAKLVSNIVQESGRVTYHIITPLLYINQRIITICFISALLIAMYPLFVPIISVSIICILSFAYFITRGFLLKSGVTQSKQNTERMKLLREGLDGIKEIKLESKAGYFTKAFRECSMRLADAMSLPTVISVLPRYILEAMALSGGMCVLIYAFLNGYEMKELIPHFSIFLVATLRLLPSFQQLFACFSQLKTCSYAFWLVHDDLTAPSLSQLESNSAKNLKAGEILVEGLFFKYNNAKAYALDSVSCRIPQGHAVAFIGGSGSGKTTLVNIISGLIRHEMGLIKVDGTEVNSKNLKSWRRQIGLVSQDIFLSDRSVVENIAFGVKYKDIDIEKAIKCAKQAELHDFVELLPGRYDEIIGEKGVQLSGGQRQRIAIARALYNDPEVLIFDEGTSALDGITEKKIIKSLFKIRGNKTVIMVAHRLTTVESCDTIFLMEKGKIIDSGTYNDIFLRNPIVQQMANHSCEIES